MSESSITGITIFIVIICFLLVILFKGVDVTDESKNIVNQHMSWFEFFEILKDKE